MASLGNWDADGNGLINSTDPLYNQLYVWEDLNSDGQTQNAELTKLTTLGVSSLDYANGTFSQNGQTRQMSTLSLKAETLGRSYVQKPDGIRINTNAGQSTLRVTQVHDLNNLQPNAVYYENRSCLRPNFLGWRSETYLKTGETCSQRAFSLGENRLNVQKSTSLGSKGSHSLLFLGAGSYEINSTVKLDWITS